MFTHIMTATDGSDYARKGLDVAIGMAKTHNAKLTILHATELHPDYAYAGAYTAMAQAEQALRVMQETGKEILKGAKQLANDAGVEAETLFAENEHPATAIDDYAQRLGCDLIVIGSRGRRGLTKLFLGSQAAEVLAGTTIPVLIVK